MDGLTSLTSLNLANNKLTSLILPDLPSLIHLDAQNNQLTSLDAVLGLSALTELRVGGNPGLEVSGLSGLSQLRGLEVNDAGLTSLDLVLGLTELESLQAQNNQISDLSGLSGLTQLNQLYLDNNGLSDLTDLAAALADQQSNNGNRLQLGLSSNGIKDVSPLAGLTHMGSLDLNYNQIEDITPLSGLTTMWQLSLRANDLSYLNGTFDDWTNGTSIDLNENPLLCSEVDGARSNGNINIQFDTVCYEDRDGDGVPDYLDGFPDDPAAGRDTDGDGQPDRCDAICLNAGYVEDLDDDNDTYADLDDAFPLDSSEWLDSDNDGVGDNSDAYPDDATRSSLEFSEALNLVVDNALRQCIENNASGNGRRDVASDITNVSCGWNNIQTLEGLEHFTGIEYLELRGNNFTDLTPVLALKRLEQLLLGDTNAQVDYEVVGELVGLKRLSLSYIYNETSIGDAPWLSSLARLTYLELSYSGLTSLDAVLGLSALTELRVGGNPGLEVSGLSGLSQLRGLEVNDAGLTSLDLVLGLTELESLQAQNNQISDLSGLSGLTQLNQLYLDNNGLSDLTDLAAALADQQSNNGNRLQLGLSSNGIKDVSPLAGLTHMGSLDLNYNQIEDITPLSGLTTMWQLSLRANDLSYLNGTFDDWTNGTSIDLNENPLLCSEVDGARSNGNINIQFDTVCYEDRDGDGVPDYLDGFPDDPAAGRDTDGDGQPDRCDAICLNAGYVEDLDDDNDTYADLDDAFPLDSSEWLDSDNDGVGDNSDAYPDDATRSSLEFSEALNLVVDNALRQCIENNASGNGRRDVASDITNVSCGWNNIQTLEGLEHFTGIEYLELRGNNFTDLTPVLALKRLEQLLLGDTNAQVDYEVVGELVGLKRLSLSYIYNETSIGDAPWLSSLARLTYLELSYSGLTSLDAVLGLSALTELRVGGNPGLEVSGLSGLSQLRGLEVNDAGLTSLDLVLGLTELESLQAQNNQISDLSGLSGLTQLNQLYLDNNQLTSLTLPELPNLGYLRAGNNQITSIDLTNVPNLYGLYLDNNGLSDLTDLAAALADQQSNNGNRLQLGLSSNGIKDVSPLAGLTHMGSLDLNYNQIEDITPLSGLTTMWQLSLRANDLSYLNGTFDDWTNGTSIDLNENPLLCSEVDGARSNGNINIQFDTVCYEDRDGDGVPDYLDGFPDDPAAGRDTDGDGQPDRCDAICLNAGYVEDLDDDNDTYADLDDAFPLDSSEWLDSDNDGVGDNSDAYPDDATRSSLEFSEALNLVVDNALRQCIENNASGNGRRDVASDITNVSCGWNNIQTLEGLEHFTGIEYLELRGNNFTDLTPVLALKRLEQLLLGHTNAQVDYEVVGELVGLKRLSLSYIYNETSIGDAPWLSSLARLTYLELSYSGLTSLDAVLGLSALTELRVGGNPGLEVSGLSGLSQLRGLEVNDAGLTSLDLVLGLTELESLQAQNNQISDLSGLSGLTQLNQLYLDNNGLSDLTDLAALADQQSNNGNRLQLGLSSNGIKDVSPLAGLTHMGSLDLNYNQIEDITPLSGLTTMWQLSLRANDLSYLNGTFDDWTNGTSIDLNENPLLCSEVDGARSNGNINIQFDTVCYEDRDGDGVPDYLDGFPDDPAAGRDTDGDGQPDRCDAICLNAGYVEDLDDDNDTYADLDDAFPLDSSEWLDSDNDGVGDNSDAYPDDATRSSLEFSEALNLVVDNALRQCIENNASGNGRRDVASDITNVSCGWNNIQTLEGLEHFTGIEYLELRGNNFTDLTPVLALKRLEQLLLGHTNAQVDYEVVGELVGLKRLSLSYIYNETSIGDAPWLSSLARLTYLELSYSGLTSLDAVLGLSALTELRVGGNPGLEVSGLSGLSQLRGLEVNDAGLTSLDLVLGLTELESLQAQNNQISDLSGLSGLTQLNQLYLDNNGLSDLTDLAAALADQQSNNGNRLQLGLSSNGIKDVSPLAGLTRMGSLDLNYNQIEDITPLSGLTTMWQLSLRANDLSYLNGTFDDWTNGTSIDLNENPLLCSEVDGARSNGNINIQFDTVCDSDGDGFLDDQDAFPSDIAASVDTDDDGSPDDWNDGFSSADSTSDPQLVLDDDDDGDGAADADDDLPKNPYETSDRDADGFGDNAEANQGTDPDNSKQFPGSGGMINMGAALVSGLWSDGDSQYARVIVRRMFSGSGEISVDYSTFDGPDSLEGLDYIAQSGTLTWADGDRSDKVILVPVLSRAPYMQRVFSVRLSNQTGGAQLGAARTTVTAYDSAARLLPEGFGGYVNPLNWLMLMEEGQSYSYSVSRVGSSQGRIEVPYDYSQILSCGIFDEARSSPVTGTFVWEDGDQADKALEIAFVDDDIVGYAGDACGFTVQLKGEAGDRYELAYAWDNLGNYVYVLDNDLPESGLIIHANAFSFIEEDEGVVQLRYVRRGNSEKTANVSVQHSFLYDYVWLGGFHQGRVAIGAPGTDFSRFSQELIWLPGDLTARTVDVEVFTDDADQVARILYFETVAPEVSSGSSPTTVAYIYDSDEDASRRADTDGDGVENILDIDLDGDGIWNTYDDDLDGDGVLNSIDHFRWNPDEQVDSDFDGVGDQSDAYPNNSNEQYDSDGDGFGDNTELSLGSDPNDSSSYPGSGGLISARSEVVVNVDRNDGQGRVIEVRVNRLLSGNGEVSVDYTDS